MTCSVLSYCLVRLSHEEVARFFFVRSLFYGKFIPLFYDHFYSIRWKVYRSSGDSKILLKSKGYIHMFLCDSTMSVKIQGACESVQII